MPSSIISLAGEVTAEDSVPAPDRLLAGNPRQRVWNYFSDPSGEFHAGRWSSTPGRWRVRYTENELCVLTSGRVVLESSDGKRHAFAAGDAFVIPAGFEGTWEVLEACVKIYAIFEPA